MEEQLKEIIRKLLFMTDEEGIGSPVIASAPGRVNLIGEHTDYNEGFVLPCAINLRTYAVARRRRDKICKVFSLNLREEYSCDVEKLRPSYSWWGYIVGCAYFLEIRQGFNIAVWSNVPMGGGLSSSASLEMASVQAISTLFGLDLGKREMAFLSKRVENEFVGVPCGIMDQFCSALGEKRQALLIDCRTYDVEKVPFPKGWKIVVCDSGVKHELGTSEYKKRQEECQRAVRVISVRNPNVRSLRDVDMSMLESIKDELDPIAFRRAKYVIEENKRVIECAHAIREKDKNRVQELFMKSHIGLSKEYEVSCDELDTLVEIASDFPAIVGARMTGGGFGGNTVNIVEEGSEDDFIRYITENYEKRTGRKACARKVEIDDGVRNESL